MTNTMIGTYFINVKLRFVECFKSIVANCVVPKIKTSPVNIKKYIESYIWLENWENFKKGLSNKKQCLLL
jgi:hypothetical protein